MTSNITKLSESPVERGKPRPMGVAVQQTAVLVLGMHRSGTSATTRVMSLLGADLPSNLMLPRAENNEAGFWESLDVYQLNDQILASAGSAWDDWRRFNPDWDRSSASQAYKVRALQVLEQDFSRSPLFVLKDPRICRLLPFWLDTIRDFGSDVKCVLPLRNPLEIAASLKNRDGFSPAKSYMLWLRHVLDAEKVTRKLPRVFIAYDDLLGDWRGTVDRVTGRLGIAWPRRSAASAVEIDKFLDDRHRHHSVDQASIDQRSDVAGWVREASKALAKLVSDPYAKKPRKRLDAIRAEFNRASDALGAVMLGEEVARKEAEQSAATFADEAAQAKSVVSQRDTRIGELEREAANRAAVVQQLSDQAAERKDKIVTLEQSAVEQGAVIAELRQALTDRDKEAAELRETVADRDREAAELRETVTDRDRAIAELRAKVEGQRDRISRLESAKARLDDEIKKVTGDRDTSRSSAEGLQGRVDALGLDLKKKERAESQLIAAKSALMAERNRLLHRLNELAEEHASRGILMRGQSGRRRGETGHTKRGLPPRKCFGRVLSRSARRRLREEANLLIKQGLFDVSWYIENNPDVILAAADPVWHWTVVGWREGRDPNPLFDTDWYLDRNPDVADAGVNPLVHFVKYGADEGRDPNPFFDTDWYLAHNPNLKARDVNPLAHYLSFGGMERRDPGPLFDTSFYIGQHPDVIESEANPLVHFFANGADASQAKEIWGQSTAFQEVGRSITSEEKQAQFQPSERFVTGSESYDPTVTVVVPNYDHAPYLRQRLESIYRQTYANTHVVLLDDCSSDNSREILSEYKDRFPDKTTIVFNEVNSGGVFNQWRKGIELANSDLIWIAESDDFCDENFLSELIPYFMDEAVSLAYSHSVFVDENGKHLPLAFENYLAELSPDRWQSSYVATAHDEVARYLGRKNTIPNVSSVVFRKPDMEPLLQDGHWLSMKVSGDWVFYLHLLKGGKLAYSTDTHNYFRFHSSNSSAKTYSRPAYYREHEAVACEIARNYRVPDETLNANRGFIESFYMDNAAELIAAGSRFSDFFDEKRVSASKAERKPNLVMAAFSLSTGGGEVFPIRLANYLKTQGYAITFFNFKGDGFNPAMRRMLRADIPLVERNEWCPAVEVMLEQFGIEVVHTHHVSVDVYFGSRNKASGARAKHVVTMHGMYEAMRKEVFELTLAKIAEEVGTWVYIAEKNLIPFGRQGLQLRGGFAKIPNGMQRPEIKSLSRSDYDVPEDAFLVCLASRAIPDKGWRKAIDIVELARQRSGRDIHLLLLGDGPVYEELAAETLATHVHLLGFRQNVVDYYAMSDLGLLPTTFEGESFPLSIIECFMAGRPIMVSDVGEVRDMLSDASGDLAGILIDVSTGKIDEKIVAEDLVRLATSDEEYITKTRLAQRLAERFDMKRVGSQYSKVYCENSAS